MALMFQLFPEDKRALGASLWGLGASLGAFNTCFLSLGIVALATIIPTLFLTDSRAGNRSLLR
jgi:hypothetical protein